MHCIVIPTYAQTMPPHLLIFTGSTVSTLSTLQFSSTVAWARKRPKGQWRNKTSSCWRASWTQRHWRRCWCPLGSCPWLLRRLLSGWLCRGWPWWSGSRWSSWEWWWTEWRWTEWSWLELWLCYSRWTNNKQSVSDQMSSDQVSKKRGDAKWLHIHVQRTNNTSSIKDEAY